MKFLQVKFLDLCLFLQVFPYGLVPLKTYLPDVDIDLTAPSCPSVEDAWVSDVYAVLREEEHNKAALFEVKDIHCIDAEVPPTLITCLFFNLNFFRWIGSHVIMHVGWHFHALLSHIVEIEILY